MRVLMRNLRTGASYEHRFKSQENVERAILDQQEVEYLYRDGTSFVFMDPESFDQTPMDEELVTPLLPFLKENTVCKFKVCEGDVISIMLPDFMLFEVVETTPWVKGSTAQGGTKSATLETGLSVQVPLFVEAGDTVRVDTRTGQYLARA